MNARSEDDKGVSGADKVRTCNYPNAAYASAEVGRRSATCEEVGFLVAKGVYERNPSGAMLLTVGAACNLLRRSKAPAATITSVQGLLGAKPMTAAEISSLAAVDVVLRNDGNGSSDEEGVDINGVPLVSIAHRKARTVTALQKASEDSAAALQRPNHESLAHHSGGQAPGESSSPLDWRASQVRQEPISLLGSSRTSVESAVHSDAMRHHLTSLPPLHTCNMIELSRGRVSSMILATCARTPSPE